MTTDPSRLEIELAGLAMLLVVAVAAGFLADLLGPALPGLGAGLAFLVLMAVVLAAPWALDGGATAAGATDRRPAESGGTGLPAPDDAGREDGGVLDVELVNWANPIVGETCLLCEEEVVSVPLGGAEGESAHRIECGCTVIESTGKG